MSTTTAAARSLSINDEGEFSMVAANAWNGTDLHAEDGQLRFTREDPEGEIWIGTLSRNRTVGKSAVVSGNLSAEALAAIAWALWMDR